MEKFLFAIIREHYLRHAKEHDTKFDDENLVVDVQNDEIIYRHNNRLTYKGQEVDCIMYSFTGCHMATFDDVLENVVATVWISEEEHDYYHI